MNINAAFEWKCQPQAEGIIVKAVEASLHANKIIQELSDRLLHETSTRLFDWLDHVVLEDSPDLRQELVQSGFIQDPDEKEVYFHPGAQLPKIVIKKGKGPVGLAVLVDYIADFLMVRGEQRFIEGSLCGNYRRCTYDIEANHALWVVERRGTSSMHPTKESAELLLAYYQALEKWQTRPRSIENEEGDLQKALEIAQALVISVGQTRAAWTVLEVERRYWQARNRAAQIQKSRQDNLGMGWSNHDHHTFRSSRRHFYKLVQLFEILGFRCRERFYAGEEAGWGAQVMEHPTCRFVLFLDVDLAPHEIVNDFAYQELQDLNCLNTVGLWCALHGDSIQHAGMHHLEAQFMFDNLTEDLSKQSITMMNPFSKFPYLQQAFTQGEIWPVDENRICSLRQSGLITEEQAHRFLSQGALGSHLENLQRREGYKGFNQKNVSIIIQETDPRKSLV